MNVMKEDGRKRWSGALAHAVTRLESIRSTDIRNKLGCMDGNTGWYKWQSNGWHFEHVTITLKLNTLFEMMMIKVR